MPLFCISSQLNHNSLTAMLLSRCFIPMEDKVKDMDDQVIKGAAGCAGFVFLSTGLALIGI